MKIMNLMTTPLLTIDREATAMHAAKIMAEHHVTSVLVNTDTQKTGVVTQDDVLTCRAVPLQDIRVKDLPIYPTQRVQATMTCEEAIKLMIRRSCRKLIVTKDAQNIGVFTLTNILNNPPAR
jgi:predicted transcriptional regulator